MRSDAVSVDDYLAMLPDERRESLEEVREVILANLPEGYEEAMNWGMITYQVPLSIEPDTYNGQPLMYAALASQKNHMAVYLTSVYSSEDSANEFRDAYLATGKKLDMGKSCVRFRRLDDLPLELIGTTIAATPVDDLIAMGGAPAHTMIDKAVFDPAALDSRDRYKLLSGLVVPRPIGWVGTRSATGEDNLAPYSFFNLVVSSPPTLMFAPGMSVRLKDSLANVRDTKCFTISVVTDELAEAMNVTSGDYPPDVDEFDVAGLDRADGDVVAAPMVADAKANFECVVVDIYEVGPGPAASVVFGEVVRIHVRTDILDGTRIDFGQLGAVGRLAGDWYARTHDLFEMPRPTVD